MKKEMVKKVGIEGLGLVKKLGLKMDKHLVKVKKVSPEILITFGIIGVGTGMYAVGKATLKAKTYVDEVATPTLNDIEHDFDAEIITEEEKNKSVAKVYRDTSKEMVKIFAPSVIITSLAIGSLIGSHRIMKKRNVALAAAYTMMEKGFLDYRQRVVNEFGGEKDQDFRYGVSSETITVDEVQPDGKTKKVKKTVRTAEDGNSIYARFFDETSTMWTNSPQHNLAIVRNQQNLANDILKVRGHLFLNEVYDMLGIDRIPAGQHVGWIIDGQGDGYVDFGLYDISSPEARKFINGYEASILLDFNVDGIIYDKI